MLLLKRVTFVGAILLSMGLTQPASASAQASESGLFGGIALGLSNVTAPASPYETQVDSRAMAVDLLRVGYRWSERWSTSAQIWSSGRRDDGSRPRVTFLGIHASAEFYPWGGGAFVKGGAGIAALAFAPLVEGGNRPGTDSFSVSLGLGYNVRVAGPFYITPFIDWAAARMYEGTVRTARLGLGLTVG